MVKFDAFTNKHLKYFMEKREDIKFPTLKEKRKIVDEFVKNNKVKFKIEEYIIPENKLFKLADTQWVYKEALNSIDTLKANYKISWNNDCIIIKATENKFKAFKERLDILLPMLNYLKSIKNTKEPRNINMYLLLTPLKSRDLATYNIFYGHYDEYLYFRVDCFGCFISIYYFFMVSKKSSKQISSRI